MSAALRATFLTAGFCFILSLQVFADETNATLLTSPTSAVTWSTLNAYLEIQEQLRATQLAIESNRLETASVVASNTDAMVAHIRLLEQTIADERAGDAESARKTQQITLALTGVGIFGLAVMLAIVYFQWRAAMQLMELTVSSPALAFNNRHPFSSVETGGELPASARAAVEFSNARLLGVIERLEKRILEWEQTTRAPLAEKNSLEGNGSSSDHSRIADLIAEGQLFIDAGEPERALKNFDEALAIEPKNIEVLVKKAAALEKLNRIDEAIGAYDNAIAADNSTTVAYLHKGGLFNRLARYDEALQCYEQALKNSAREKVGF
jgi:tetratricopeptide (TPR) repeat protein